MDAFKRTVLSPDFWLRVVYTLLLALAWQITELLLIAVTLLQLAFKLFTGEAKSRLTGFGNSLSQYAWQIGRFVTFASEQKPWPFMEWPDARAEWQPVAPVQADPDSNSSEGK
ncbi:DUF4389 domain-containing protein [Halopseudomonas sp.]|uniref:DUF4389 domain-containing protein n=1 Tax=Halopseudomonas sp. TaxID=2901191 RepID=UPI0035670CBF